MRFNVTNNRGVLSLVPLVDCNPFHISNLYAFFNKTAMEFLKTPERCGFLWFVSKSAL